MSEHPGPKRSASVGDILKESRGNGGSAERYNRPGGGGGGPEHIVAFKMDGFGA